MIHIYVGYINIKTIYKLYIKKQEIHSFHQFQYFLFFFGFKHSLQKIFCCNSQMNDRLIKFKYLC